MLGTSVRTRWKRSNRRRHGQLLPAWWGQALQELYGILMVVTSIKKGANGFGYIAITTTLNMKEHFKVGLHAISKIGVTEQADLIKPVFSCQHWTGNESYFLWQGELVDDRFRVQNRKMKLQFRILNLNFGFQFSRGRLLTIWVSWKFHIIDK